MSWINHLPPACRSTFWKSIFKHQLGCRFDILDSISSFFLYFDVFNYICLDTSYHFFWLYLYFLNIHYFSSTPVLTSSIDVGFVLYMGTLTKTPNGNTCVFMVFDQFTKWIECYPLPEQGAELLAKTLVNEFFARFGCSCEIHSDQGKTFLSKIFVSVTRLLQITKTRTTAYRPNSNGQVERSTQTLLQMMRCLRDENISA